MIDSDFESHNEFLESAPLELHHLSEGELSLDELPHLDQFKVQQKKGRPPL